MSARIDPTSSGSDTEQELREELDTLRARRRALDEPDEADSVRDVGDSAESLRRADERVRVEDRIARLQRRLNPRVVDSEVGGADNGDTR